MKTVKIVFVSLCFLLVVFLLSIYTLTSPRSRDFLPLLDCDGKHLSWMCGKILRLQEPEDHSSEGPTSVSLYATDVCPGLHVSFPLVETEVFQIIEGSHTYIYSAFNDNGMIRIIGIRERNDTSSFYCQIWSDTIADDVLAIEKAFIWYLPESHSRRYTAIYIECSLPRRFSNHPRVAVSVSRKKCGQASAVVPVLNSGPMTAEFIVCVPALKYDYDEVHALVESIEFKRLLGASKLVFYNHSIGENVNKVLHFYKRHGLVDVHQWHLPVPIKGHPAPIHTAAQLAANNDCVHRNRMSTQYIVVQDVDEFIIPRNKKMYNWTQLVNKRLQATPGASTFQVRNVFFRKEWISLVQNYFANADIVKYKSVVLQHTMRELEILDYQIRSKCIYNPRKVHTVGIHGVWKTIEGELDEVPARDALMQHYRKLHYPKSKKANEQDTLVVDKYGFELLKRVKKAWINIEEETGLKFDELTKGVNCDHVVC